MNKELTTNSKVLNELLFDGTGSVEDTHLFNMIEELKRATLLCSELCVTVEYEDVSETRDKLAVLNRAITETWQKLSELLRDFSERPAVNCEICDTKNNCWDLYHLNPPCGKYGATPQFPKMLHNGN